jgi:fibronectin type 3 domain-containing protein
LLWPVFCSSGMIPPANDRYTLGDFMIAYARPSLALLSVAFLTLCGCTTPSPKPTPPPTVPSAPTNLTTTAGNAQVSLSWTAPTGATSYEVQRSSSNGGPYSTINPKVVTTTYTDTTVTNGTTYYYDVFAVNSIGISALPAQASATPEAPPQPPANLTALPGNAVVSLSWSASPGATGYNLLRSTASSGPYAQVASGATTTNYNDTSVTNGTTYYYVVQAVNVGGTSGNSNEVLATPSGEVQARVTANQEAFYVYKGADSGFNHGFASGWFVNPSSLETSTEITKIIQVDSGCVDDPADTSIGCYPATDTLALDTVRGPVLRMTFSAQSAISYTFAGVNIEEPEFYATSPYGVGYNLEGVKSVTFDVRSPVGAQVSFGVG